MSFVARGRRQLAVGSFSGGDLPATITLLASNVTRMAPAVVHANAVSTTLIAGDYHTSRFQWTVTYISGPGGWTPLTCLDPRPGLQEGDTINSATECEGFNFAFFADVAGTYRITLTVTDEDYNTYTASTDIVIAADTRTALYVSGTGNDTTGNGTIGNPWRQPSKAWEYVLANGRSGFTILLNRGDTYDGFDNGSGLDGDATQIVVAPYGSGAPPSLTWNSSTYPSASLLYLTRCEAVVISNLNFKGNDADNIHNTAIELSDECLNIGLVGVTFGGAGDTDYVSYCFLSNANNPRSTVPPYQGRGYALFNCSGHCSAYFMFMDIADTGGNINSSSLSPTASSFEVATGELSAVDDAYNGMSITIQSSSLCRNQQRVVLDYVANTGAGLARFDLATPLSAAPNNGDHLYIVNIDNVGDSDVFLFGCINVATAGLGNQARIRIHSGLRITLVGSELDVSETAAFPKDTLRTMASFAYSYRCHFANGQLTMGLDLSAQGIGPFSYQVADRCHLSSLEDANGAVTISFSNVNKVVVKSCVLNGGMNPSSNGVIGIFDTEPNSGVTGADIRVLGCTIFHERAADGFSLAGTSSSGWPDDFLTYENNLFSRSFWDYQDFMTDISTSTGMYLNYLDNVYAIDQSTEPVFRDPVSGQYSLAVWVTKPWVDGDVYGSITPSVLVAADFVPSTSYVPETTNRTTTSLGVFQDYYGRNPVGGSYVGAVSRAP